MAPAEPVPAMSRALGASAFGLLLCCFSGGRAARCEERLAGGVLRRLDFSCDGKAASWEQRAFLFVLIVGRSGKEELRPCHG